MNIVLVMPEIAVVLLGLGLLLLGLWTPAAQKRSLGYAAMAMLGLILAGTFLFDLTVPRFAFSEMFVLDEFSLFFKRFFLVAAIFVLGMSIDYAECFSRGIVEYYALVVLALAGMMLAASANHFAMFFIALELVTITLYVLTSFQTHRPGSLEAGTKYLLLGALASAFLIYGIALIFGSANTLSFTSLAAQAAAVTAQPVFRLGVGFVLIGLGFKIASVPCQFWVPDVYQGAPIPTVAFLAVGSKATGFVLLMRLLFQVCPVLAQQWRLLLILVAGATILYGNLCAIPQRNLKRLLGYSSIANAGYLLLGVATVQPAGAAAILYYLGAYLFSLMAAFTVMCLVMRQVDQEETGALAGLHSRSPLLAAAMGLAMISLAGIPPLGGFIGKFLLLKSVFEQASRHTAYVWLVVVALVGIVISLYYYLRVVRTIYWTRPLAGEPPCAIHPATRLALYGCVAGMLYLGVRPDALLFWSEAAVRLLQFN